MPKPTPAVGQDTKRFESKRNDEEKLSLSQQLNYPEPLWLTAHLPDPEPAEFSAFTRCATAQSPLPCELPSKARDKSHPAVEIGDHHDGCSVRAVGLAEVSKTPSDQTSSGGETKDAVSLNLRGRARPSSIMYSPRVSRYSTTSSLRTSLVSSIFSEPQAERSSMCSSISSWSMTSTEADPFQAVLVAKAEQARAQYAHDCENADEIPSPGAENESKINLTSKFQIGFRYCCTVCHERFARKRFWKLHEERCHEGQTEYSCLYCGQTLSSESQFRVHHRNEHACSPCHCMNRQGVVRLAEADKRRTAWGCGFCAAYLDRWEERCSHVGDHFDSGSSCWDWEYSNVIVGLLHQPVVAQHWQNLLVENHGPNPESHIIIQFSKPKTGGSDEAIPELQGLLEFGAVERDVKAIARLAYDLGVRPRLKDTIDLTTAETKCDLKLSTLIISEEVEKDSASPSKPPEAATPTTESKHDPFTLHRRNPSYELKPGPILRSQHLVDDVTQEAVSTAEWALQSGLRSPSAKSESFENTSSDPDDWSTSSVLTGDSTNSLDSASSEVPSCHESLPRNGQWSIKQAPTASRKHSKWGKLVRSLVGTKYGVKECAPRDDSISAGSKHSFSNSSSSSIYSGLRNRGGSGGGSGGRRIGGEDKDEDGYGENNYLPFQLGDIPATRKLACPYFKRNPSLYSGTKFRSCQFSGFASVHRLKEHLYRKHRLPLLCGRCNTRFHSRTELQNHQKNEVVCEPSFETPDVTEGFSGDQERKLRSRKRSGLNEAGKWGEVYRILFPDDIGEIPSPFCTSDMAEDAKLRQDLKSELSGFIRDSSHELSRRVRRNLELNLPLELPRLEELAQAGLLDAIMAQCHKDMQDLVDEFLSGSNPQSRTMSLDEFPVPMEDGGAAAPLPFAAEPPDQLNLAVDGFGPLESEGVAAYWPSDALSDAALQSSASGEAAGWQIEEPDYGSFDRDGVLGW